MIDAHCHMQFEKFDRDSEAVIKDAISIGVTKIVNTGTSIASSKAAVELAQKYEELYAIVGIHPHHADKTDAKYEGVPDVDWLEQLETIAKEPKVIGIGEIGMDFYHYKSNGIVTKDTQEDAFRKQIELSIKLSLPLQIHTRLAWDDTLSVLTDYKNDLQNAPGMFHCFSGDIQFARKVLDAGFYTGFDGNITYGGIPPGETTSLLELVKYIPEDRILTETDSPFLSPQPLRGQRNTPSSIPMILDFIAKTKGISYNTLEAQIELNFQNIFGV